MKIEQFTEHLNKASWKQRALYLAEAVAIGIKHRPLQCMIGFFSSSYIEVGQGLKIFPGTYDSADFVFYTLGGLSYLSVQTIFSSQVRQELQESYQDIKNIQSRLSRYALS